MARLLLKEIAGMAEYRMITEPDTEIEEKVAQKLNKITEQIAAGVPLQYALGYTEFYGRKFIVNPSVLIPRPETEELADTILRECKARGRKTVNILDICSGSGCITHTLQQELPNSTLYGCDISTDTLSTAASQPYRPTPHFFKCDILSKNAGEIIRNECEEFEIIVSNPPYVCEREKKLMRPNVLEHEPHLALFVPDDNPLLFYHSITEIAYNLLHTGGTLYFEINEAFSAQIYNLLTDSGFNNCKIIEDLNGKPRIAKGDK